MEMRVQDLWSFIFERYSIHQRRTAGTPKPWTVDPIFLNYRFCNVYRELDRVTAWIRKYWREPHQTDKDVWFAMAVARFFNNIDTLQALTVPLPFEPAMMEYRLEILREEKARIFNPAYIVSTNGVSMDKCAYVVNRVLWPLWNNREKIRPQKGELIDTFFKRLKTYNGLSNFMAAQIVADVKFVAPLFTAPDFMTFAASGPGSRRGLNRVCGYTPENRWVESTWYSNLLLLKLKIDPWIDRSNMPPLSAQDLQNCLCEFDKYERARLGQGKPKQRYNGASDDTQHSRGKRELVPAQGHTASNRGRGKTN